MCYIRTYLSLPLPCQCCILQKPEGTKGVKIGELIALSVAEGEDWQNVTVPSDVGPSAATPVSPPAPSGGVTASPPTTQAPTHASGRFVMCVICCAYRH